MTTLEQAIAYVRDNINKEDVDYTIGRIYRHHGSLSSDDPLHLSDQIYDLMEEFSDDNDLPEGWWLAETDEDEILLKL